MAPPSVSRLQNPPAGLTPVSGILLFCALRGLVDRNEDEMGRLQPEGVFSSEVFSYKAVCEGLPWWLRQKESACSAGDLGLIPGLGRSPGEGNVYPLQYSCLENPMGGGVHGVAKCQTRLSNFHTQYVRAFICGGEQGGVAGICSHPQILQSCCRLLWNSKHFRSDKGG